jgi:hypothetical protein
LTMAERGERTDSFEGKEIERVKKNRRILFY